MQLSVRWVQSPYGEGHRGSKDKVGSRANEKRITEDAAKDKVGPGPMRRRSQRIQLQGQGGSRAHEEKITGQDRTR